MLTPHYVRALSLHRLDNAGSVDRRPLLLASDCKSGLKDGQDRVEQKALGNFLFTDRVIYFLLVRHCGINQRLASADGHDHKRELLKVVRSRIYQRWKRNGGHGKYSS